MKKSTRNLLILFIIILFIVCLFSFNVNGIRRLYNRSGFPRFTAARQVSDFGAYIDDVEEEAAYDYAVAETAAAYNGYATNGAMSMKKMAAPQSAAGEGSADVELTEERKLVKTLNIDCETQDFDKAYKTIENEVKNYEAIVDNQSLNNGSIGSKNRRRSCNFTIRVPEEKLNNFVEDATKGLNVTYRYESVEDITDNYNDTLARLDTYKEEEKKLNELIKKADRVEDMVNIENRLSDVRYNIQSIEKRIANMDKTVDYSTIYLNISEVVILTKPKDVTPTKDTIMAAFKKNLEDTKLFIKNTGVYIFTHLPAIAFIFVVALVVLIILIIIVNVSDSAARSKEIREAKIEEKKRIKEEKRQEKLLAEEKKRLEKEEEKETKKEPKVEIKEESNEDEVEVEIVEMPETPTIREDAVVGNEEPVQENSHEEIQEAAQQEIQEAPSITISEDAVVDNKPDTNNTNKGDDPYTMDLDFTI